MFASAPLAHAQSTIDSGDSLSWSGADDSIGMWDYSVTVNAVPIEIDLSAPPAPDLGPISQTAVPEPSTFGLALTGAAALYRFGSRKRSS